MSENYPERKSIRLKGYDYSLNGAYYVTICTQDREYLFGEIVDGEMKLNELGKIVHDVWESLPNHHPVELDVFQIMPNHVHFVIFIIDSGRSRPTPTLGLIVGLFKSECTKQINSVGARRDSPLWQRNYYEHIIRNEGDLNRIREYIIDNPMNWMTDELNNLSRTV